MYKTISESGCWRSTVSVPQRGPWAAWSQGALRGLSQTPVSSRAGWGCRAGWLIGGWSVGSHCQAQSRLLTASYQQTLNVFSAAPGDTGCAHGAGPCVCARVCLCCGRGMPGLLGCPRARQHNFESACVWRSWYPPLVHPSEAVLGLCWVLGTCDNWMGSPPSRSLFVLGDSLCFAMGTV